MIRHLFESRKPFAVVIDTIEMAENECTDYFYIVPKTDGHEFGMKFKTYRTIVDYDMTRRDIDWFKSNKEKFKLVLKNKEGLIYEPVYVDFRRAIKKYQFDLPLIF